MSRVRLTVILNGTDTNRWSGYGLTQNPFPQIAKAELHNLERRIAALDGEPITSEQNLRDRLRGFTLEFVELCVARYRPGHRVGFDVYWDE